MSLRAARPRQMSLSLTAKRIWRLRPTSLAMKWTRLRMITVYSDCREKAAAPVLSIPEGRGRAAQAACSREPRHQRATGQPGRAQSPIRARIPPGEPVPLIPEPPGEPRLRIPEARVHPRPIRAAPRGVRQLIRAAPRGVRQLIRAPRPMNTCRRDRVPLSLGREINVRITHIKIGNIRL